MDDVVFKGRVVTRPDILGAIRAFDAKYPDTNDYKRWLEKAHYKYALLYEGKKYPPKHILSEATGVPWQEFGGGVQQTNCCAITWYRSSTSSLTSSPAYRRT